MLEAYYKSLSEKVPIECKCRLFSFLLQILDVFVHRSQCCHSVCKVVFIFFNVESIDSQNSLTLPFSTRQCVWGLVRCVPGIRTCPYISLSPPVSRQRWKALRLYESVTLNSVILSMRMVERMLLSDHTQINLAEVRQWPVLVNVLIRT